MNWELILTTAFVTLLIGGLVSSAYVFGRTIEGERTWRTWLTGAGALVFLLVVLLAGGGYEEDFDREPMEPNWSRIVGLVLAGMIAFTIGFLTARDTPRHRLDRLLKKLRKS